MGRHSKQTFRTRVRRNAGPLSIGISEKNAAYTHFLSMNPLTVMRLGIVICVIVRDFSNPKVIQMDLMVTHRSITALGGLYGSEPRNIISV